MLILTSAGGCSLFVMFGKMVLGDPKMESAFKITTGVDLTKAEHRMLVVCHTPSLVRNSLPTIQYNLNEEVLRRLKQHGILTVNPDEVAGWMDDNGGEIDDPSDLARDFDCDFITIIDVRSLSFHEPSSPSMYRGHAQGGIRTYEVNDQQQALQVFTGEFKTEYPRMNPISTTQISERVFQKRFVDHLGDRIARQFFDYRIGDDF